MAGATLSLRLDGQAEALSVLGGYIDRARDKAGLFEAIGMSVVVSTQHRFETGVGPDGSPWPPSLRALATGGKTLIESGRLMRSISYEASPSGVEVGTNVIYGAIHQFGGAIHQRARTINMPARPFLGLDDADDREILQTAEDWISGERVAA